MSMSHLAKTNVSLKAQVMNVRVREGKEGLFYATSPQLKGLLVAEATMEELERAIPKAIADLYLACGLEVVVSRMESDDGDGSPWVAFPAEVAKAGLERLHAN